MNWRYRKRRAVNVLVLGFSVLVTVFGLVWLGWILWTLLVNGLDAMSPKLFSEVTPPPGSAGGLGNAILGSALITLFGILFGAPIGVLAGTWLAEYGRDSKFAAIVRFVNDLLLSAPSIIIGIFVYALLVATTGHFSGWAGSVALAIIVIPVVVRTTENTLQLVPDTLREAAAALGSPQWKIVLQIAWRAARGGIVTGVLLGLARISGETAPLLFTALNGQFWSWNMSAPIANLPVTIYQFAMGPYEDWHHLAWAGALLITAGVLGINIVARIFVRTKGS